MQRLSQAVEATLEHWVETARIDAPRPDVRGPLQEAQPARLVQVATESRQQALPAGSWWLPLDQPLALLAVVALEPDSPSSYFANRLLRGLDSAARVMKALPAPSPGK